MKKTANKMALPLDSKEWVLERPDSEQLLICRGDNNEELIATVHGDLTSALIMATAPELLEALERLARQVTRLGPHVQAALQTELRQAGELIAKAKG